MNSTRDILTRGYCCSSWQALCFWGCAFVVFYAAGLLAIYWLHLQSYQTSALFAALGLACVANAVRNRTFHCVITGPFFLLVALTFGLVTAGVWKIPTAPLWATVVIVVCAALLLERRFAS
ncbi:MAG TPA: hypothetical protein VNF00_00250 [Candidatus Acidoferrales bacterium]|nr:hypothetical protein [Candidatus Acidoferrales bacterium]